MSRRGLDVLVGAGLVLFVGAWALGFSRSKPPQESVAKRVADAIATRNPAVMRALAQELDETGQRDLAEGLRMAADLTVQQQGTQ